MRRHTTILADLLLVSCLVPAAVHGQTTLYVDDDAATGGDGATWSTAYRYLQDALAVAIGGDDIRVAGGTYKPDQDEAGIVTPGDRDATFHLINGVGLYGGYAGLTNPGNPDERDIDVYATVLSGDLNGDDGPDFADYAENSHHVVTSDGTDNTTTLDGCTVTAGNADEPPLRGGGGMLNFNGASPTVASCTFFRNRAYSPQGVAGGGMGNFHDPGGPTVINCMFVENVAEQNCGSEPGGGGGMYNGNSVTVINSTFIGN